MQDAWFCILALMLTAYAVLDGFDFGAGIVHLWVAKTNAERQSVFAAIGPLWDGNEVWLIASGGVFVFAFPRAYAAAFSGMYLPLMVVLWLLVLRGIAIEFRSTVQHPLWHAAWDATFSFASAAMAVVLGVALGNVVRGVPLDASGYFQEDLFATLPLRDAHAGAIDPFSAVYGVLTLFALAAHGATFLTWKTSGEVNMRSRAAARWLWRASLGLTVVATAITPLAAPRFFERILARPWLGFLLLGAIASAAVALRSLSRGRELRAFLASCAFLSSLLIATAGALYPILLRSTVNDAFTLDIRNASSPRSGLATGLMILAPAIALAAAYFAYLFRTFQGKATGGAPHD